MVKMATAINTLPLVLLWSQVNMINHSVTITVSYQKSGDKASRDLFINSD
jgi:hypothetical protein